MNIKDKTPNISNYLSSKTLYNSVKNSLTGEITCPVFIGGNCLVVFSQTFNYINSTIIENCLRECMDNYNSVPKYYDSDLLRNEVDIYIKSFITFRIHDIIKENIFDKKCYDILFKDDDMFKKFRDIILEECKELDKLILENFDDICKNYKNKGDRNDI